MRKTISFAWLKNREADEYPNDGLDGVGFPVRLARRLQIKTLNHALAVRLSKILVHHLENQQSDEHADGGVEEDGDEEGGALVLELLVRARHDHRQRHVEDVQGNAGDQLLANVEEEDEHFPLGALEVPLD